MSISRRVTLRRLLTTGAAALTISAFAATSAYASGCPGGQGWDTTHQGGYKPGNGPGPANPASTADQCEFSLDGNSWASYVKVDDLTLKPGADGKVHVQVRVAKDAANCTASLASYRTHGAKWETSGKQVFHDWDTVSVKSGGTDTLDVSVPDVGCFAQVDLYKGSIKYDGGTGAGHGLLPEGPNGAVIKDKLITSWNGGSKDCTAQVVPSSPATTPPAAGSAAPSTPAATAPESSTPNTPSAAATPSSTPSASDSASASTAPTAAPSASGGDLAETGSSGMGMTAAGAAVLLVAGGGVLFAVRRRKAPGQH